MSHDLDVTCCFREGHGLQQTFSAYAGYLQARPRAPQCKLGVELQTLVVRAVCKFACGSVRFQDRDLEPLRERREWLDALGRLKGGVSDSTLVQLVSRVSFLHNTDGDHRPDCRHASCQCCTCHFAEEACCVETR